MIVQILVALAVKPGPTKLWAECFGKSQGSLARCLGGSPQRPSHKPGVDYEAVHVIPWGLNYDGGYSGVGE